MRSSVRKRNRTQRRKRGAAIIVTRKGILLVKERDHYYLPGGGADRGESRRRATIREVKEETNLTPISARFLFFYRGVKKRKYGSGKPFRDYTKVYLVKTRGRAKPSGEVKGFGFWKKGSRLKLSRDTKRILDKFIK